MATSDRKFDTICIIFEAHDIFLNLLVVLICNLTTILGQETIQKFIDLSLPNPEILEKQDEWPEINNFIFYSLMMIIYVSLPKEYFLDSDPQVQLERKEEMSRCPIRITTLISKSVSSVYTYVLHTYKIKMM